MACEVPRQFNQKGVLQSVRKGTTLETRRSGPCGRSRALAGGFGIGKWHTSLRDDRVTLKALRDIEGSIYSSWRAGVAATYREHKPYSPACYLDPTAPTNLDY
jgi:hypothetical protein